MIYDFDTTATSPVIPEVLATYVRHLGDRANNSASAHEGGLQAARSMAAARQSIAASLDCLPQEVFFTSGGTESINHAIKGVAWSSRKKPARAVTTAGEHDAVLGSMTFLEQQLGYEIALAHLLPSGSVDPESLFALLTEGPLGLVSIISVNNETGAINDLETLVPRIRRLVPHVVIHSDIVQVCGKMPFSFRRSGIDLASISGHKFGAPKGTGLLLKRDNLPLTPLMHGGGQQAGVRSGTENVPGAVALTQAMAYHQDRMAVDFDRVRTLRKLFILGIEQYGIPHRILSS
ncbi:MAG TPA: aminotransferase class V-fold PLP-dependent enzyme, partial [Clostridia bacterium]|nr:aminotransferase class V-fold PLP-dependent enzyme [Clostridia bacterium]